MKKNNLILGALSMSFIAATLVGCGGGEKKPETAAVKKDTAVVVVEELAIVAAYPKTVKAAPVSLTHPQTKVQVIKKQADPKNPKAKPVPVVKEHKVSTGNAFVNANNDVVGGVIVTVADQDTMVVHITKTDTTTMKEKQTKRKFKGIVYLNQDKYTFETPFTVTKSDAAVDIDGDVLLTPVAEGVAQDGKTTGKETVGKLGDPIQVKIKTRFDGDKVVKLEDLKTGAFEKKVYNKQGLLIKEVK